MTTCKELQYGSLVFTVYSLDSLVPGTVRCLDNDAQYEPAGYCLSKHG